MGRRAVPLLLLACWLLVLLDFSPAALFKERSRRQRTTPTVLNLMPVFTTRRQSRTLWRLLAYELEICEHLQ